MLILGPQGVAAAAAAGVLLTATGTVGGLAFAGWAALGRIGDGRRVPSTPRRPWSRLRPSGSTGVDLWTALAALPAPRRRVIELAYFGGLSHNQIAHAVGVPAGR